MRTQLAEKDCKSVTPRVADRRRRSARLARVLPFMVAKAGGGAFGDMASKIFGGASGIKVPDALTTPLATINASVVNVNGATSGVGLPVGKVDSAPIGPPAPLSNFPQIPGSSGILDASGFAKAASSALGSASGLGHVASQAERAAFYIEEAKKRGLNPDVIMQTVKSEGFGSYVGDKGTSFGDFQLHYKNNIPGLSNGGLGDAFTKQTGLDARDPSNWREQGMFSLDKIKSGGLGPWHGWKGDPWAASGGQRGASLDDLGQGADSATKSVSALSDKLDTMPDATNSFTSSLEQLGAKLSNASFSGEGGGFKLPGFGGLGGGGGSAGASDAIFADGLGVFGFANGGYTGPGHRLQPAGIVHSGEYVIQASAVSRLPSITVAFSFRYMRSWLRLGGLVSRVTTR